MSTNQFFHHDVDQRDNNPQRFLSSPEAKGIITPQSNRSFHERANLINKSSVSWLYITTAASWTRAHYEIWWKPRTKLIYKEQRQEIKAIKIKSALDRKTKRDEKRECKNLKNQTAKHKQKEDKKKRNPTGHSKNKKTETRN
jgi:cobalamin-dependent methionine synthase I